MADYFMLEHDGVIYFDANSNNGKTVFAYSTVNQTMWIAIDMSHINSAQVSMRLEKGGQFIGDDLFFSMKNSTSYKTELWVYSIKRNNLAGNDTESTFWEHGIRHWKSTLFR